MYLPVHLRTSIFSYILQYPQAGRRVFWKKPQNHTGAPTGVSATPYQCTYQCKLLCTGLCMSTYTGRNVYKRLSALDLPNVLRGTGRRAAPRPTQSPHPHYRGDSMPQPHRYRSTAAPYQGRHCGSLPRPARIESGARFVTHTGCTYRLARVDESAPTTRSPHMQNMHKKGLLRHTQPFF